MADAMRVGVDLIEIERVRRTLGRYPSFRERCFTEEERRYCDSRANPAQHYAARSTAGQASALSGPSNAALVISAFFSATP